MCKTQGGKTKVYSLETLGTKESSLLKGQYKVPTGCSRA